MNFFMKIFSRQTRIWHTTNDYHQNLTIFLVYLFISFMEILLNNQSLLKKIVFQKASVIIFLSETNFFSSSSWKSKDFFFFDVDKLFSFFTIKSFFFLIFNKFLFHSI